VAGKQVLVTGGAGFIGSHLVRALAERTGSVRVLDNLSTGKRENLSTATGDLDIIIGDIRNPADCERACCGVEAVFHLAAYVSVPGSVADPAAADAINIGGTLNLLLAAKNAGVKRFVFSSSSAVYGDTDILPTPETILPMPASPYGVEKLYGEHLCRLFHSLHGMQTVALRYFNVYGPGQNPESDYAAVIPKFITTLLQGCTPTIFGDGAQTRDFLYVGDVVHANLLAAKVEGATGETFNIARGTGTSLNDLTSAICAATGVRVEPIHGPERPGDIKHSSADICKAKEKLRFEPEYDLERGLRQTVAFYRATS